MKNLEKRGGEIVKREKSKSINEKRKKGMEVKKIVSGIMTELDFEAFFESQLNF